MLFPAWIYGLAFIISIILYCCKSWESLYFSKMQLSPLRVMTNQMKACPDVSWGICSGLALDWCRQPLPMALLWLDNTYGNGQTWTGRCFPNLTLLWKRITRTTISIKKMFDLAYMDLDQNDSVKNNIFSCSAKPIEFCILLGNATPVKSGN